jgi:hypothetical protein
VTFPDGFGGRVVAGVRGRDLRTDASNAAEVLDEVELTVEIDPATATIVATSALDALVGLPLRGGYGRGLGERLPDDAARRSVRFSALEDVGGAYLVSGYAALRAGVFALEREHAALAADIQGDVCIGWALDGPVIETLRVQGHHAVPYGPVAPVLEGDDPLAWHEYAPLVPPSVRRRRRTDVTGAIRVEHHFRDSYAGADNEEVMHEYLVAAAFDDATLTSLAVEPRVLPWYECPGATPTAQRLIGVALDDIAPRVRAEFHGASTCTHLNSTLRTLADVRTLSEALCTST